MVLKLLILGGTSEANRLAECVGADSRFAGTLSLAGRTEAPRLTKLPTRVGGFGGAEGLAEYLRAGGFDVLVDATHPFAQQISANAQSAASAVRIPLIAFSRPPWQPIAGDRWTNAGSLIAAAAALPREPSRVFLTVGRQSLIPFAVQPQHHYVIRVIDPPEIPAAMVNIEVVAGRGPFEIDAEIALLRAHRIDWLVTKNSGGKAASAKLAAARALGIPVILVEQPGRESARLASVEAVLGELERHRGILAKRSV